MILRPAQPSDAQAVAAVSLAAGQPATDSGADPRYFDLVQRHGRMVVAARPDGGRIIGWGATRRTALGEILSDLFVEPRYHGHGVGSLLLRRLWPDDPPAPGRFTFSSRHPSALPLYARSGLQPAWPLLCLTGEPARLPIPTGVRATLVAADQAAAAEARLTSFPQRLPEYAYWAAAPAGSGVLVHQQDRLLAAGAGRPGALLHLACGDGPAPAVAAMIAALQLFGGQPTTVCLPGPHPALGDLLAHRWRVEDYDLAMSTPDVQLPISWAYSPGLA